MNSIQNIQLEKNETQKRLPEMMPQFIPVDDDDSAALIPALALEFGIDIDIWWCDQYGWCCECCCGVWAAVISPPIELWYIVTVGGKVNRTKWIMCAVRNIAVIRLSTLVGNLSYKNVRFDFLPDALNFRLWCNKIRV